MTLAAGTAGFMGSHLAEYLAKRDGSDTVECFVSTCPVQRIRPRDTRPPEMIDQPPSMSCKGSRLHVGRAVLASGPKTHRKAVTCF